jgi:hypothetical protein
VINVIAAAQAAITAAGGEGGEEMPSVLAVPIDELIIGIIAFIIVFGGLAKRAGSSGLPRPRPRRTPLPSSTASSWRLLGRRLRPSGPRLRPIGPR